MVRQTVIVFVCVCFFISSSISSSITSQMWRNLSPGIDYLNLAGNFMAPWSQIHVLRIDLKDNQISLVPASNITNLVNKEAFIDTYAKYSDALIAINGGFFDNNVKPLGLRISDNRLISPLKYISWWGVFYIKNNKAYINNSKQFSLDIQRLDLKKKDDDFNASWYGGISFAIQSGPRLLINNKIPSLKYGRAQRSAIGITKDGKIIIVVTQNSPLTTMQLAKLMQSSPLNCQDALNLDGGSSSQLLIQMKSLYVHVHGFSKISDAVIIKAKNH